MHQIHATPDDPTLIAAQHLRGGDVVVILRGDIDRVSVPHLQTYLEQFDADGVLKLDLGQLDFIDVSGALLMLQTATRFHDQGGAIVICDPPNIALRLFDLLGVSEFVEIEISERHRGNSVMSV